MFMRDMIVRDMVVPDITVSYKMCVGVCPEYDVEEEDEVNRFEVDSHVFTT